MAITATIPGGHSGPFGGFLIRRALVLIITGFDSVYKSYKKTSNEFKVLVNNFLYK